MKASTIDSIRFQHRGGRYVAINVPFSLSISLRTKDNRGSELLNYNLNGVVLRTRKELYTALAKI